MARHKKHAQRKSKGCKVCGNPKIGRGIDRHVEAHNLKYDDYKTCFEKHGEVIFDELKDTGKTTKKGKKKVILHVLVRRFEVDS